MRVAIVYAVLLALSLSCKPAPRVSDVFKAEEEATAKDLATECRPDPNVKGDQIEVCRQSITGLENNNGSD